MGQEARLSSAPLGEWAAVQGRWLRAAEYLKMLVHVDQMETWDVATLDCTRCAVAMIEAGDKQGYDRFRREMINRFVSTSDPVVAERTVKNSLLLPADSNLLASLAPLAALSTKAVPTANPTPQEEPWPGAIAWRCDSLALWSYRRGRYSEAVGWCERCVSYGNDNPARVATADAILAMSYYQLGQPKNARTALALSRNLFHANMGNGLTLGNGGRGYWFDWMLARILADEAAAMDGKPNLPETTGAPTRPK
jgi:eukaryotic-like serine/threonine-protein kinase